MRPGKRIRADLILIGALLLAAGALFLLRGAVKKSGEHVVVYRDGDRIAVCSLQEDKDLLLVGAEGGSNLLRIRDGAADMIDADCPDRICVYMYPISKAGETIVCLPHRIMVCIESVSEPEVDIP